MQNDESYPDALARGYHLHWYLLERVLGQGGFGITYLARDTNLDQRVAIKEYLPVEVAARRGDSTVRARTEENDERYRWGLARFIREARTLARFDHPNIVRVLSVFEFNNTAYMVMRFEEGSTLAELLERSGTLGEGELLRLLPPILDGLELVHDAGFIHRDIKPDNILIRADGTPVLLDFGSARQPLGHAPTMTILVAPGYAPFEQYYSSGENQGPWTDIYALGATCYRAISGAAPVDAITRSKGVLGSAREMLVPASVIGAGKYSARLLKAIDHALEFEERKRPQSIAEWRRELQAPEDAPQSRPTAQLSAPQPVEAAPRLASSGAGWPVLRTVVGAVVALAAAALLLHFYPLAGGGNKKPAVAPDPSEQLKQQIAKLEQQINEQQRRQDEELRREEEARKREEARKQEEARRQEEARKQAEARQQEEARRQEEAKKKLADERRHKLAQQRADAARKKQEDAERNRIAAERRASQQAGVKEQVAAAAPPAPVTPPPSPAQQLAKAKRDYAAGNYSDALAVIKPMAEHGNADAQVALGNAYVEGRGVKRDEASGAGWYRKAAKQGNAEAQFGLGKLYASGTGVPQSDFEAYVRFGVAARAGIAAAKPLQDRAGKSLQPVEIEQADTLIMSLSPRGASGSK